MFNLLLSLLFPKRCLGCGKFGQYFCENCLKQISSPPPVCPVCTKPSFGGETHPRCKTPYSLDGFIAVFKYQKAISSAIRAIKYGKLSDITLDLTNLLTKSLKDASYQYFSFINHYLKEKPALIPIPLHWIRQKTRFFNQSEIIGQKLAKNLEIPYQNKILTRTKTSKPQAELLRKDRLQNVRGIFAINPSIKCQFSNNSYLLFDDVWTTGATIREASKILKRNGAKKVWALTIAR